MNARSGTNYLYKLLPVLDRNVEKVPLCSARMQMFGVMLASNAVIAISDTLTDTL